MIANKYKIIEKINKGSFGIVFSAENILTKEILAIKFENKTENTKSLKNEAKIYQYLGKLDGFPQLKLFGTTEKYNYLVMNLLGKSLENVISNNEMLSPQKILHIGIQIIKRIQTLHSMFLLHRDIKPSNLLFGTGDNNNKLFLVDFGFTKRYNYDGKHIEKKQINNIVGSINFVSLNVHHKIEPSRRDDIESGIYVILNMVLGKLQWFNKTNEEEIIQLKSHVLLNNNVPIFLKNMLRYVWSIKFDEAPNYDYLVDLMVVTP